MQSHYISHQKSTIHYLQFGNGPKLLFCFHGYGRESDTFAVLLPLAKQFTIVAIDVPFHGRTNWQDEVVFEPAHLKNIVLQIAANINPQAKKLMLLGFSMGGRIALHLTQLMPTKVERVVLLAPDGLSFHFWRWFGSNTWVGNKLLAYVIHKPGGALWLLNKIVHWGLLSSNMAGFLRYYLEDKEHRLRLYNRYIAMRRFNPSIKRVKRLVRTHSIAVRLLFGRHDKIIPVAGGSHFIAGIENLAQIKVAESGHNLLNSWQLSTITKMLTN